MDQEPITIRYEYQLEDFVTFQVRSLDFVPALRRYHSLCRWIGTAAIVVLPALINFMRSGSDSSPLSGLLGPITLAVSLVPAALFWWFYPALMRRTTERLARNMFSKKQDHSLLGEYSVTADAHGLHSRSRTLESRVAWEVITRMECFPDATYLFMGSTNAIMIPHQRVLEGNVRAFLEEVGRRVALPVAARELHEA